MVRWHVAEVEISRQRRASAVDGVQGNGGEIEDRRSGRKPCQGNAQRGWHRRSRRETAVNERRKEMAVMVTRHQAD